MKQSSITWFSFTRTTISIENGQRRWYNNELIHFDESLHSIYCNSHFALHLSFQMHLVYILQTVEKELIDSITFLIMLKDMSNSLQG